MSDLTCALWYVRRGSVDYDLFGTEEQAARYGIDLEDDLSASVFGVQFADGRLLERDDWPLYADLEGVVFDERRAELEERRMVTAANPHPVRRIADPFAGQTLEVETDAPAWLGKQKTDL